MCAGGKGCSDLPLHPRKCGRTRPRGVLRRPGEAGGQAMVELLLYRDNPVEVSGTTPRSSSVGSPLQLDFGLTIFVPFIRPFSVHSRPTSPTYDPSLPITVGDLRISVSLCRTNSFSSSNPALVEVAYRQPPLRIGQRRSRFGDREFRFGTRESRFALNRDCLWARVGFLSALSRGARADVEGATSMPQSRATSAD